jgi:hypothetical protein
LYYKRKAITEATEKDTVTEDIIKVTEKIKNTKKELFYCDNLIERSTQIRENVKCIEEEKWKKQNEKEQKMEAQERSFKENFTQL